MARLIVTGANGAGKSHLAAQLAATLPDHPLVCFDALKLTTNWRRRPRARVEAELAARVAQERWILEGGPGLLALTLPRATEVVWLDPPTAVRLLRLLRLLRRPWRHRGRTRPGLPEGNIDRVGRQTLFALSSLWRARAFRLTLQRALIAPEGPPVVRIRTRRDVHAYLLRCADTDTEPSPFGSV